MSVNVESSPAVTVAPSPVAPAAPVGGFSLGAAAAGGLASFHRATARPATILGDATLVAVAGLTVTHQIAESAEIAVGVVVALLVTGRYRRRQPVEAQGVSWYVGQVLGVAVGAGAVIGAGLGISAASVLALAGWMSTLLVGARGLAWWGLGRLWSKGAGWAATLVVGSSPAAQRLFHVMHRQPRIGLRPVARIDPGDVRAHPDLLAWFIETNGIEQVIVEMGTGGEHVLEMLRHNEGAPVSVAVVPGTHSLFLQGDRVLRVGGTPLLPLGVVGGSDDLQPAKRAFDVVVASVLLIALAPVLAVVALAVKLDGGPVLYRQPRVGRWGRPFRVYKFRSMVPQADRMVIDLRDHNAADGLLFKVHRDPRVTAVGRVIRRLALDELPQLVNVIRGEMSLVGPRPLPVDPEAFGDRDGDRHRVPPGITGLWQVSGDNALTYEEMVELDLAYVNGWSLWLDIRLLLHTVPALVRRMGPS